MTQTISKPQLITLEEFLEWYPDDYCRYELHDGVIVKMQPTGRHEQIIGFLAVKLGGQIDSLKFPYFLPYQGVIKGINSDKLAFKPDVTVLDWNEIENEPMWEKRATITKGKTVKLVVEVVSTNWQDDYGMKAIEYEKLGIAEYWIVDYLGLGGRRFIGNPKQPTISIYQMVDGEYEVKMFRSSDKIESSIFPELNLTAQQIFEAGKPKAAQ